MTTNEIPAQAMYIEPAERITRPNHGETIGHELHINGEGLALRVRRLEARTDRLEAWTREEIFARTAMDEPDPDAGGGEKWRAMKVYAIEIGIDDDMGWEQHCRLIVAKAIELGLAVSPDTVDALNAQRGPAVYHDEQDG